MQTIRKMSAWLAVAAAIAASNTRPVRAQERGALEPLDSLIAIALAANPDLKAADARAAAFRWRVAPAGAWEDPRLMFGTMNVPVPSLEFRGSPMTQSMIQLQQMVPFPGKPGLRQSMAEREAETMQWEAQDKRLAIVAAVKAAYLDLYAAERALEVTARHEDLLRDFLRVVNVRYRVGEGLQPDVLKSQVELAELMQRRLAQNADREVALADLNALLNRSPVTPASAPQLPQPLVRIALRSGAEAGALPAALTPAQEPIPGVEQLIEVAKSQLPMLQAYRTALERQRAMWRLTKRELWPDLELTVGYGIQSGMENNVTAQIGISIPIWAGRKQLREIDAARAEILQAEAAYQNAVNQTAAEIARLRAQLVRMRDQLLLLRQGVLPQAAASLKSATAAYQVGRVDFLTLLDNQATLYRYEIEYHRMLADFAKMATELERMVGKELFTE